MRTAIAWSYEGLPTTEQKFLAGLGVFQGSFGLDAAEAVLGAAAFDRLRSLVRKSLVQVEEAV